MCNHKCELVVYYFAHKELCIQELKLYYTKLPSVIEVVYYDGKMDITNLQSAVKGKGYATALLVHASKEALKRGITHITLDDCSDNWNKPNNLYIKAGLEYIDSCPGPEMKGCAKDIANYKTVTDLPSKIFSLFH
jgi:hypothetical protein